MKSGSVTIRINDAVSINPRQNQGPDAELRYVLLELSEGSASAEVRILWSP